jgi:hypothetical protein
VIDAVNLRLSCSKTLAANVSRDPCRGPAINANLTNPANFRGYRYAPVQQEEMAPLKERTSLRGSA